MYTGLCESQSNNFTGDRRKCVAPFKIRKQSLEFKVRFMAQSQTVNNAFGVQPITYLTKKSVSVLTWYLAWTKRNDLETNLSPGTPANFSGLMPTSHRRARARCRDKAYIRMERLWERGRAASLSCCSCLFVSPFKNSSLWGCHKNTH